MMRLRAWWEYLRGTYWAVPSAMAMAAVVLSFGMIQLDEAVTAALLDRLSWVYTGGPEGVASIQAVGDSISTAEPDPAAASPGTLVTTDTLQRRQSSFATATDLYGPLLAADEDYPSLRAVHDYWPDPLHEDAADLPDQQSVRHDDGDVRAVASSTLAEPALGD